MNNINFSIPSMKCKSCKVTRSVELFGDKGNNECYKSCDICRFRKKRKTVPIDDIPVDDTSNDNCIYTIEKQAFFKELISNYLKEFLNIYLFSITPNRHDNTYLDIDFCNITIVILTNDVFHKIKKRITTALNNVEPDICPICCTHINDIKHLRKVFLTCKQCYTATCSDCCCRVIYNNKGLLVCSYCKDSHGEILDIHQTLTAIQILMRKADATHNR